MYFSRAFAVLGRLFHLLHKPRDWSRVKSTNQPTNHGTTLSKAQGLTASPAARARPQELTIAAAPVCRVLCAVHSSVSCSLGLLSKPRPFEASLQQDFPAFVRRDKLHPAAWARLGCELSGTRWALMVQRAVGPGERQRSLLDHFAHQTQRP